MKQITTIKLDKDTVKLLGELKIHHRQSYEEVILKLLENKKKE
jgi:predicted CopG family antitoxin